jgi:hypothetical protein
MDIRPTLDKSIVVKPSRPGWKALVVVAALFAAIFGFVSVVQT